MGVVKASHRYARISATKVRPFAELIRGMTAADGIDSLRYVPNRGARFLEQVLKSAIANAEEKGARNVEKLKIVECRVDRGPHYKRMRPRARGTAFVVKSQMSHLHVAIDAPELQ